MKSSKKANLPHNLPHKSAPHFKRKEMGTFKFELNKYRLDGDGKAPIRLNYSVSNVRKRVPTGISVFPECWNYEEQEIIYLSKKQAAKQLPNIPYTDLPTAGDVDDLNDQLDGLILSLKDVEKNFTAQKITYSAEMVVNAYRASQLPETKKDQSHKLVPQYIDKYCEEQRTVKANASLVIYRTLKNHLENYGSYKNKKIRFAEMDNSFFLKFQTYLIEQKNLKNTTVAKQLSTLKTILNYAAKYRVEVNNDFRSFKIKKEKLGVIALSRAEMEKIIKLDLSDKTHMVEGKMKQGKPVQVSYSTLDKARDFFIMGCATGMRYSDLAGLRWENIKGDEIWITVKKTKEELMIPINEYSAAILEKNAGKIKPLPQFSNQRLNDYVKLLARESGINTPVLTVRYKGTQRIETTNPKYKLISAHTSRKTFVTVSLENGMSAEETMATTGHSDYQSFKKYLHITNKVKKTAMSKAWSKPKTILKAV